MTDQDNLPDIIPLFPLPGALLLPRARLPLQIFEPRYLTMLDDVLKTPQRLIGMIQPDENQRGDGTGLQAVGCVGRVIQFSEAEDERYMITLLGLSRFRLRTEVEGFHPYRRAEVVWPDFSGDLGPEEQDADFDREEFLTLLAQYFNARELRTDWDTLKEAEDEMLINSLSMLLEFSPEDKQALLEAPSLSSRRETLRTLIEFDLRGGGEEEILQ